MRSIIYFCLIFGGLLILWILSFTPNAEPRQIKAAVQIISKEPNNQLRVKHPDFLPFIIQVNGTDYTKAMVGSTINIEAEGTISNAIPPYTVFVNTRKEAKIY